MSMMRRDPFSELTSLRDALDRLFDESFIRPARRPGAVAPPMDIYQEQGNLVVKVPLPGAKPEDIEVSITGDRLTVHGEIRHEKEVKEQSVICRECSYGAFSRSVTLPGRVDSARADATYKDGMLALTLPLLGEEKRKTIKIQAK
ncbi:MAG TPA: Hsp20/alpha crystallin family protein [Clostridiales bacterium UBA8153]|nr:Hsp20/alpha crystallin family protein [Clostridiales bacterium UBA8153]